MIKISEAVTGIRTGYFTNSDQMRCNCASLLLMLCGSVRNFQREDSIKSVGLLQTLCSRSKILFRSWTVCPRFLCYAIITQASRLSDPSQRMSGLHPQLLTCCVSNSSRLPIRTDIRRQVSDDHLVFKIFIGSCIWLMRH